MKNFNAKYYEELLKGLKNTASDTIHVNNIKSQKNVNFIGTMPIQHSTIDKPILLIAECSRQTSTHFGFKLLSKHFLEYPFFRFESYGSVHQNRYADIPLAQQQILTPHFHCYDAKGRWIAYHTDELCNAKTNGTIKNVQTAFTIFCNETNVRHNNTMIPTIKPTPPDQINLKIEREDPLENVNFASNL